jgi:hypothetical protein
MWLRVILCIVVLALLPVEYLVVQKLGDSPGPGYILWVTALLLVLAILWWPRDIREAEE